MELHSKVQADFFCTITIPVTAPEVGAEHLNAALVDHDVVHMVPDQTLDALSPKELRNFYNQYVEAVGEPVDIAEDFAVSGAPTGERWSEIQYRDDVPDLEAFRHSKNAQPLHTDESYVSSSIGVMLFYCVHAAPSGGETVFVGGHQLLAHLETAEPDFLRQLVDVSVAYQKAGDTKSQPIIRIDPTGTPTFNFNYYCVEPDQSAQALKLNQEFHDFCQTRLPATLIHQIALRPGESLAWKDDRVVHGRNSFSATKSGDRLIWKTGIILSESA